jgi:hypothetical protein
MQPTTPKQKLTMSGVVLSLLLGAARAKNPEAVSLVAKLRAAVDRSMLWRFATGQRAPEAETIAKMHAVTGGLVAGHGWAPIEAAALSVETPEDSAAA